MFKIPALGLAEETIEGWWITDIKDDLNTVEHVIIILCFMSMSNRTNNSLIVVVNSKLICK
mgnify:CR=1 FL=1